MNISENLAKYESALRCRTQSEATVKNYLCSVGKFLQWCNHKKGTPTELVQQYIAWGMNTKCAKTKNLNRAAILSFFSLVKNIKLDVPRMREPKHFPKIIPQDSVINAINKTNNIKHKLELCLFYGCGMRLSEVANLKRKNIFLDNGFIQIEHSKGDRHRIVPIPPSIIETLSIFIKDLKADDYVFAGQKEGCISKKSLENVVSQAFERIGEEAHPHMLRHSFATHQIIAGENPFKLQSWMGHSSIKTTQGYVTLAASQLSKSTDLLAKGN